MPRRDGTCPMNIGKGTVRKRGGCFGEAHGMHRTVYGYGCHLHRRLRDGTCRYSPVTDRIALASEKEFLENRLKVIDRMLNEDSVISTDQPNV